ncbi:hypothetical protein [Natronosalvus rutilus]|uniref:Uncharacterized protein n=1 Tax=Natronosalvus rutilus TaxID=2953753 RepID=A0A9E7SXB7_9EURY|nr:hypothetical protein [Natronosalvus rutilus]UTF56007.1 hypothetical protein NGM29_20685 [Natronosalvus rutilus]
MNQLARPPESYPEDIRDAFEYCEDCEKVVVSVGQHTCPTGTAGGRKSASDRTRLAKLDGRPLDSDVLYPEGRSENNAWAYHELDESGDPLHDVDHDAGHQISSRSEAIEKGCYPCGMCRLIQDRRGGEDDG